MKYENTQSFVEAVQNKSFDGRVVIDNDCVYAYDRGQLVFDFEGRSPDGAFLLVLEALGANVDYA